MDIEEFRVQGLPAGTAFYVPDFLSQADQDYVLAQVGKTSKVKWTQLSNRRLQNWGGVPQPKVYFLFVIVLLAIALLPF